MVFNHITHFPWHKLRQTLKWYIPKMVLLKFMPCCFLTLCWCSFTEPLIIFRQTEINTKRSQWQHKTMVIRSCNRKRAQYGPLVGANSVTFGRVKSLLCPLGDGGCLPQGSVHPRPRKQTQDKTPARVESYRGGKSPSVQKWTFINCKLEDNHN